LIVGADTSSLDDEVVSGARRPNYRRYWLALYRRRVEIAEQIVAEVLGVWPPRRIYHRLFEPALALSGTLFARGVISYNDEHFITYHTTRLMRRVRHTFVPRRPTGPLALASGVGQESHLIGLRMVCDFLQAANWRIRWLATHERGVFREAVTREASAAVLLSVGRRTGVVPARRIVGELQRIGYGGVIAVGGQAIAQEPELVGEIGADLTARNGLELLRLLRCRGITSQGRKE
jgi:methanogenic corrinoid protein MtbC1